MIKVHEDPALPEFEDTNLLEEWDEWTDEEQAPQDIRPSILSSDIDGRVLNNGDFRRRQLSFTNICNSELRYADFENANLIGVLISLTKLHGANFRNCDMEFCELDGSDFSCANFQGCNLQSSSLTRCDFRWANLRGANLADCRVQDCDFYGATVDSDTVLPFDKTYAQSAGMIFVYGKISDAS